MPLHEPIDSTAHTSPRYRPGAPPRTPLRREPVATHVARSARRPHRRAAISAGLFGGVVVGILTALSWAVGLHADLFVALGLMTGVPLEGVTQAGAIGLVMFAALSALSGLAYVAVLRRTRRSGAAIGALLGLGHGVLVAAALLVGLVLHPTLPYEGGRFWPIGFDLGGLLYVAGLHVVYGAIVGAIAARRHPGDRATAHDASLHGSMN